MTILVAENKGLTVVTRILFYQAMSCCAVMYRSNHLTRDKEVNYHRFPDSDNKTN